PRVVVIIVDPSSGSWPVRGSGRCRIRIASSARPGLSGRPVVSIKQRLGHEPEKGKGDVEAGGFAAGGAVPVEWDVRDAGPAARASAARRVQPVYGAGPRSPCSLRLLARL